MWRFPAKSLGVSSFGSRYFATKTAVANDVFLQGSARHYIDAMYEAWQKEPSSVHLSWQTYFRHLASGVDPSQAFTAPPPAAFSIPSVNIHATVKGAAPSSASLSSEALHREILDHMKVQLLVRAYQVRGHRRSTLDPLGILRPDLQPPNVPELEISFYGFTSADLDRSFVLGAGILLGFRSENTTTLTLRQIVDHLERVYCGVIGYEYMHIADRAKCDYIRSRIEVPQPFHFTKEQKWTILDRLMWSDSFERFVHGKYPGEKRFGLEGCEALVPGMKALIDRSVEKGVDNIVMGMPHRGRLNVLSNVVRKPNESIFYEFSGLQEPSPEGSGDVKYHLGMNYERPTPSGKKVYLSLVANPSHLEAVDPVVLGKTRALQFYLKDEPQRERVMSLLLHGDAAFAAQGVVYETLGFHDLPQYTTGGTVHLIVNNQIGFTTDPRFARSTPYCSDIAKTIQAPILHVNGDDVESVVFACQFASDWRQLTKSDVVVDIVCYRRHGHNEFDEPMFTQPRMYKSIAQQKRVLDKYVHQLVEEEKLFTAKEVEENRLRVWRLLEESYERSRSYQPTSREWVTSSWPGFKSPKELSETVSLAQETGVPMETLQSMSSALCTAPPRFHLHKGLQRIMEARKKSLDQGQGLDMATAESLAFGTLLLEGIHVRLSGQDVERGTFSQRHCVLNDQETEEKYTPLNQLAPETQATFSVCNSSLSEFGTLGFELGYSLVNPRSLVLWEAQFGDFCNNAQCIIDQFLAAGEQKWLQRTGLVMLLPHGYDGAGPEHSSGRLERFLQLCDDHPHQLPDLRPEHCRQVQDCNMQVIYPSTPANYFHALRRQVHRDFRKPLICFNAKSLMRHPLAKSDLDELAQGTRFRRVIAEEEVEKGQDDKITTVAFCSGQVYYTLSRAREVNKVSHLALVRVEQISPFPYDLVLEQLHRYKNATRIVWAQEEAMNMGAWTYCEPRLNTSLRELAHSKKKTSAIPTVQYVGRDPSAAVATGHKKQHVKEEQKLTSQCLFGEERAVKEVVNGVPLFQK